MKSHYAARVLLSLVVLFLGGCATYSEELRANENVANRVFLVKARQMAAIASENAMNPTILAERWGLLSQLAGQKFAARHFGVTGHWSWIDPGRILRFYEIHHGHESTGAEVFIAFDSVINQLRVSRNYSDQVNVEHVLARQSASLFRLQRLDGSATERCLSVHGDGFSWDCRAGNFADFTIVDNAQYAQKIKDGLKAAAIVQADLAAQRGSTSAAIMGGFTQGLAEATQQQRSSDRSQRNFLNSLATNQTPGSSSTLDQAQRQSAQMAAMSAARDAERRSGSAPTTTAQRSQPSTLAQAAVQTPRLPNDSKPDASPARGRGAEQSAKVEPPKLLVTPEAVMVCTKPTGVNGNFRCSSPLNTRTGHLKDVTGARTPEEMVMGSDACSDPRRLDSSTHLVWGCGFGATGLNNAKDTGGGVAIFGRGTFYCHPRESSCRRKNP